MASKVRKPEGLFIIEYHQMPGILHPLKLRDFTGIARSMETCLNAAGIYTTETRAPHRSRSCTAHVAECWVTALRGDEIPDLVSTRKSIDHSHVAHRPAEHRILDGRSSANCCTRPANACAPTVGDFRVGEPP